MTLIAAAHPDGRHHFANLDELMSYLIAQTSGVPYQVREEIPQAADSDCTHCTPDDGC